MLIVSIVFIVVVVVIKVLLSNSFISIKKLTAAENPNPMLKIISTLKNINNPISFIS
jgi:hypothetical protein